ncbi:hypothetical protein ACVPOR_04450 [Staphylococcus aureus]
MANFVVGKRASEGIVEVKERLTGDSEEVHIDATQRLSLQINMIT